MKSPTTPNALFSMLLGCIHLGAQLTLLLFSAWFISACALAGHAGVIAGFNYVVPAALIRFLALSRIASGYFEKLLGHLHLLQALHTIRQRLLAQVFAQQRSLRQAETAQTLQQQSETQAARWTAVLSPLCSAFAMVLALSVFVAFWLPALVTLWLIALALIGLLAWLASGWHRKLLFTEQDQQQRYLSQQRRWLHSVTLWHFMDQQPSDALNLHQMALATAKARHNSQRFEQYIEQLLWLLSLAFVSALFWLFTEMTEPAAWVVAFFLMLAIRDWAVPMMQALWAANREAVFATSLNIHARVDNSPITKPKAPQSAAEPFKLESIKFNHYRWQRGQQLGRSYSACWPGKGLVWLQGDSACGKSSLLNSLVGELPAQGECLVNSQPLTNNSSIQRDALFHLQQQDAHIFAGTLKTNLSLGHDKLKTSQLMDALGWAELAQWANEHHLAEWLGEQGRPISGGERQRIKLARAYLSKAPVLLLDEPFEGLDKDTQQRLAVKLRALSQHKLIVIVSHLRPKGMAFDLTTGICT